MSPRLLGNALASCAIIELAEGDRERFEQLWREGIDVHERGYPPGAYVMQPAKLAAFATLDGHLHEAVELCESAVVRSDEVGRPAFGRFVARDGMYLPLQYLGRPEQCLEVVRDYALAARTPRPEAITVLVSAVCLSQLGRTHEARQLAQPLIDLEIDEWPIAELQLRLQLALQWQDRTAAAELAERLAPVAHLSIVDGFTGCVARLIGASLVLRGDVVRARAAFEQAVAVCKQTRFRPELALARLDLAALMLAHYPEEHAVAVEHLDFATSELRAMHMQPALEQALNVARPNQSDGLTTRERQVAALLAAGLSNREVAEALVISEGTAEVHVKHILSKLGFKSRWQVAAWATERRLVPAQMHTTVSDDA